MKFIKSHLLKLTGVPITVLIALITVTTLVLATYTGPNRSKLWYSYSYERRKCLYTGYFKPPQMSSYCSCTYTTYVQTQNGCPTTYSEAGLFTNSACSWLGYCSTHTSISIRLDDTTETCESWQEGASTVTTSHTSSSDPATVSSAINCSTTGTNNWCTSPATLSISGTEPLSGYSIAAIEGAINGNAFSCSGSSCLQTFGEGSNNASYWAVSSYGDTSTQGAASENVDTKKPSVSIEVSGTAGSNNWYTSGSVTGTATDPTPGSGISKITYSLDGGAATTYSSPLTLAAGSHTVSMTAIDNAGWTNSESKTINVDLLDPTISSLVSGTIGSNSWYMTNAILTGSASDPTPGSGLDTFTISDNGGAFTDFTGSASLTDGSHDVILRAKDIAGRVSTDEKTILVDTQKPSVSMDVSGTPGSNGWYTSANLSVIATDPTPGSGISKITYALDGGATTTYSSPLALSAGTHTLSITATDNAGWTDTESKTINVDLHDPTISSLVSGTVGSNSWYITDAVLTGSASDPRPGSGLDTFTISDNGGTYTDFTGSINLADGTHDVILRAKDIAGRVSTDEKTINVDTKKPSISTTIAGKLGTNSWYFDATVYSSATDPTPGSGINTFEYSLDGSSWAAYSGPLALTDGIHNIEYRTEDEAGLTYATAQEVKVDSVKPTLDANISGVSTDSYTYSSNAVITASATDLTSGLDRIEYKDNSGSWITYSSPITFTTGEHSLVVRSVDNAGNTSDETSFVFKINTGGLEFTATPTHTITPTQTITPTITLTPLATPVATVGVPVTSGGAEITPTATVIPQVVSTETPKPFKGKAKETTKPLGFGILLGFVAMIGITISLDPRPKAWNQLDEQLNIYIQLEDKKKEK